MANAIGPTESMPMSRTGDTERSRPRLRGDQSAATARTEKQGGADGA